ncbi:MAG TPA: hypothetical protein VJ385_10750 [Fibrobacteria bacterium]|nr:hypothetical protein [Fibrobacteria bacterium]
MIAPLRKRMVPLLWVLASLPARAETHRCGTAQWFRYRQEHQGGRAAESARLGAAERATAKRGAAIPPPYRTLETGHFVLHYSLRGIHRIKTVPADSVLLRLVDSLYASAAAAPGTAARDSAVIAGLDRLGAPQPAYAIALAGYLESARGYYVGSLGMKAPGITVPSGFYRAPARAGGKYAVDIADVVRAVEESDDPFPLRPETYALTFQPARGGMLFENDFLFNSRLDPGGDIPVGDSLKSCYPAACDAGGRLVHNYGAEWEAGLKVTASHEFYHAVQFAYTPDPRDFHVWYETGAVGMEERIAPEINDYLQYLPGYFRDLGNVGMFSYPDRESTANSLYGNGIFHVYLTRELGEDFDVGVWARLEADGNDIRDALPALFAARGRTTEALYSGFAAQLAFSGRTQPAPFPLFSPDMGLWPGLRAAALDLGGTAAIRTDPQPPWTIGAWLPAGSDAGGKALFVGDAKLVPVLAALGGDSSRVEFPGSAPFPLPPSGSAGKEILLMLANASLTRTSQAEVRAFQSVASGRLFAYPNPLRRTGTADRLLFSRLPAAAAVSVYGEDGRLIRTMEFTPDAPLWSWDLMDGTGKPAKAGLYYYRSGGRTLSPLVLR